MNIGIAKIGKSIKFDTSKHNAHGGDNEAPLVFGKIFELNPDDTFYLIGRNDFSRISNQLKNKININDNIIDVWEEHKLPIENKQQYLNDVSVKWFDKTKVKLDYVILYSGPTSRANIKNYIKLVDGSGKFSTVIEMVTNYVSHIHNYLNVYQTPYTAIIVDPRYKLNQAHDLMNTNFNVSSQYNEKSKMKYVDNIETNEILAHDFDVTYDGIETVFLINKHRQTGMVKDKLFNVVLNQGGNKGIDRYDLAKEWFIDHEINNGDISIFGHWKDEVLDSHEIFKGPRPFRQLHGILRSTKYTMMIPIMKGWVTSKFWEMIYYGIIPFMHPFYDDQNNLNVPDFIRVKTPAELNKKIEFLENNNDQYIRLLNKLQAQLTDDLFDGTKIVTMLYNKMYENLNINKKYEINYNKIKKSNSIFDF